MRTPIVCHGDSTTTLGKVVAFSATIYDDVRRVALSGDKATCGHCEGLWNILGTGEGVKENGRVAVIHGNRVMCPCGKNRVIASVNAGMYIHVSTGAGTTFGSKFATNTDSVLYDEQYTLTDSLGRPLVGIPYRIRSHSAIVLSGVTDADGRTKRIPTDEVEHLSLDVTAR